MESEIQRSQRTGRSFALLLMDLDGLKQVNDRQGHLAARGAICGWAMCCESAPRLWTRPPAMAATNLRWAAGGDGARRATGRRPHLRTAGFGWRGAAHHRKRGSRRLPERRADDGGMLGAADRALYGMNPGTKVFEHRARSGVYG